IADGAAVHEEEELRGAGAGALGPREVGLDGEGAPLAPYGGELFAGEGTPGALFAGRGAEPLADDAAVARQDERDAGPAERRGLDDLRDARGLRRGRLEELAARRDVEEELAHLDHGAGRGGGRSDGALAASLDAHERALGVAAPARAELELADRRDARERLAA